MSEFKYNYSQDHLPYMYNQVWEADPKYNGSVDVYNRLAPYEVSQIEEFLPFPEDVTNILELGAGQGRGSIYLSYWMYPHKRFILADRDGSSKENTGAFNPKEDEYYCDFESTKSFCKLNKLTNFALFDTEKDDWRQLPKFDLIFSFCSLGMHVPIERYIDRIVEVCHDETVLIFGTRHAGYGAHSFKDKFSEVIFKPSLGQAPFPAEHWLILKGKK